MLFEPDFNLRESARQQVLRRLVYTDALANNPLKAVSVSQTVPQINVDKKHLRLITYTALFDKPKAQMVKN